MNVVDIMDNSIRMLLLFIYLMCNVTFIFMGFHYLESVNSVMMEKDLPPAVIIVGMVNVGISLLMTYIINCEWFGFNEYGDKIGYERW